MTAQETAADEIRDARLMTGEEVVFSTKKHWLAPVRDSVPGVLLILGALVLAWLQTDQTNGIMGFINRVLNLLEIVLMLGGIGSIVYSVIAWRSASYLLTNHRLLFQEGLLRKKQADTLLASVSDVRMNQSALGRSLGFGDVQILSSSGESGADKFTTVVKADVLKKQILEQKIKEAGTPMAPQSTTAAAAPAPAAPTAQSEAMATLNQLAALRDSGAITPQEFEAKKAELLARI
jgi:uncharacterized membrane protein YdbT with pleckstrin-like domain